MYDQTTWEQEKDDREDELRKMVSRSAVTIINPLAKLTVEQLFKQLDNIHAEIKNRLCKKDEGV